MIMFFFRDNLGKDNILPGGPSCYYKGIEIPAFVTFSEGGGIDGEILKNIFVRLDKLGIYNEDRKKGLTPFVLLDGHQSRFHIDFLKYINNPATKWSVCMGVPYGTALWQVGDSSEQNGLFKMSMAVAKKELFNDRLDKYQQTLHLI